MVVMCAFKDRLERERKRERDIGKRGLRRGGMLLDASRPCDKMIRCEWVLRIEAHIMTKLCTTRIGVFVIHYGVVTVIYRRVSVLPCIESSLVALGATYPPTHATCFFLCRCTWVIMYVCFANDCARFITLAQSVRGAGRNYHRR